MTLSDVMTRGVEVVAPQDPLTRVAERMRDSDVGFIPVCDGERILGAVTDRDLVVRGIAAGLESSAPVQQVMTDKVEWLFEDHDVAEAARLMQEKQIRRVIVVNRDKKLVGVVALGDVATETGEDGLKSATLETVSATSTPAH